MGVLQVKKSGFFHLLLSVIALIVFSNQSYAQSCNVNLGPDVYVCSGSGPVTLNANANGNGTVVYSWTINNNPIGGNSATLPVSPSGLNNPDVIECTVTYTSNGNTCTDDNTLNLYSIDPGVIGSNQSTCNGSFNPATLTNIQSGTNSLGGNNTSYSWQSSNDGVNWTTIPNSNSSTYNPPTTSNTVFFRRVVSITVNNNTYSCYSNVVSIVVVDPGIIGSNQYVCNSSNPTTLTSSNAGSVNFPNTTFAYQWQSAINVNGPWTNIPNETNSTYSPPPTQNTIYYRREFTLTVNGVDYPCYSNVITVSNISAPTSITHCA